MSSRAEAPAELGLSSSVFDWIITAGRRCPTVSGLVIDFWWLAHHETGAARLRTSRTGGAMGLGLAAALLGDLVGDGLHTDAHGVLRVRRGDPPSDPLRRYAFAQIRGAPHSLQEWLAALAVDIYPRVADRLEADGLVRADVRRRWRRDVVHWVPTDHLSAVQPAVLLARRLKDGELIGDREALLLLAIAGATGLRKLLLEGTDRKVHAHAEWVIGGLEGISREIALATRTAMTHAVLTHRS